MPHQKPSHFKKALQKTAQLLSQRSYSEKELKQKLAPQFPLDTIKQIAALAKQKKWLEDPEELALQTANNLHRKNKSWTYIKKYLQNKDLPLPGYDKSMELSKAKNLVKKKFPHFDKISDKEKLKIQQFLASRLFEKSLIYEIIEEPPDMFFEQ